MRLDRSRELFERAREVIPGAIPGIRAPQNFVEGAYPILLGGGHGGHISDVDGNDYVDLLLGYGPIILGHGEREVDSAAADCARNGFCLNLPQPIMIELAEKLVEIVPSAEQALFFKTGSDATTAAIRIARAHTGRSKVIRCGYHGWHDWCVEADQGVPDGNSADVMSFPYNDAQALEALLNAHPEQVAGIIMTPIGHDFDAQIETPQQGFLEEVRRLADAHGSVLIFDEVRTGFRVHLGGAQALYDVTPDLTALGKAMANGYPVTTLVGRRHVMQNADATFISSTYFSNGMEMKAALTTLEMLTRERVLEDIAEKGGALHSELATLVEEAALPATLSPYPQMPFLHFDEQAHPDSGKLRDRFYGALAGSGVFAHPRHHGFLCWRHDAADLERVITSARAAALSL